MNIKPSLSSHDYNVRWKSIFKAVFPLWGTTPFDVYGQTTHDGSWGISGGPTGWIPGEMFVTPFGLGLGPWRGSTTAGSDGSVWQISKSFGQLSGGDDYIIAVIWVHSGQTGQYTPVGSDVNTNHRFWPNRFSNDIYGSIYGTTFSSASGIDTGDIILQIHSTTGPNGTGWLAWRNLTTGLTYNQTQSVGSGAMPSDTNFLAAGINTGPIAPGGSVLAVYFGSGVGDPSYVADALTQDPFGPFRQTRMLTESVYPLRYGGWSR